MTAAKTAVAVRALADQFSPVARARFVFARAVLSPAEYSAGRDWYRREGANLWTLARIIGVPFETAVAAAATLSPGNGWHGFLERFAAFAWARAADPLTVPRFPTYRANRVKAAAILSEGRGLEAVTGPKVRAFAANLAGDCGPVTVDRHVSRIFTGREAPTAKERRAIAQAVAEVAAAARLGPCELQAVLWTAAVGVNGRNAPRGGP